MSKWKPFYIDTNVAFGFVESREAWERMLADTAKMPNVGTVENAWNHLTRTCLRPGSNPPSFSFHISHTGMTLQKWMEAING